MSLFFLQTTTLTTEVIQNLLTAAVVGNGFRQNYLAGLADRREAAAEQRAASASTASTAFAQEVDVPSGPSREEFDDLTAVVNALKEGANRAEEGRSTAEVVAREALATAEVRARLLEEQLLKEREARQEAEACLLVEQAAQGEAEVGRSEAEAREEGERRRADRAEDRLLETQAGRRETEGGEGRERPEATYAHYWGSQIGTTTCSLLTPTFCRGTPSIMQPLPIKFTELFQLSEVGIAVCSFAKRAEARAAEPLLTLRGGRPDGGCLLVSSGFLVVFDARRTDQRATGDLRHQVVDLTDDVRHQKARADA